MENQLTTLDKAIKISAMLGIMIATFSISYFFVVFLPSKDKITLTQQLSKKESNVNSIENQQQNHGAEMIIENENEETNKPIISNGYPKADYNKYESQINSENKVEDNSKDIEKENKKLEKERYETQLNSDKLAYNNAIEKITNDYEYAKDKINAEIVKNGLIEPTHDCTDGTVDEQRCQINERAYSEYKIELDYLEKTYKANLKIINESKYW